MTSPKGKRLAVWQTSIDGIDWIDNLVKDNKAVFLGGDGYPIRYTATAGNLLSDIRNGPPLARKAWASGEGDILLAGWEGRTVIDHIEVADCRSDEWLLVEAFDES
jgi:hypothetical protein